eukprot:g7458.t1
MVNKLRFANRCGSLRFDRREHYELALAQQDREDKRIQQVLNSKNPEIIEARSLDQLELIIDSYPESLAILFLYSRSCGSCKKLLSTFHRLHEEVYKERGVMFLKHDVHDEFDCITDIGQMYEIHAVPCFLFLSEGAVIKKLRLRDTRIAPLPGTTIQERMNQDEERLSEAIKAILIRLSKTASDI